MPVKKILILFLLIPLCTFPQETEQEAAKEVEIGSSGISLAPEEEITTPTASPEVPANSDTVAPSEPAPVAQPTDSTPSTNP